MDLPTVLCFSDELLKIASESPEDYEYDSGTRALLAARQGLGLNYLVGGKLETNHPEETNFVPKIAAMVELTPEGKQKLHHVKKKFHKGYRKARDPAGAAAKGSFYGILGSNVLSGGQSKGWKGYRIPAAIGAGLGLADWWAQGKEKKRKVVKKVAGVDSGNFTPGRQLTSGRHTAAFKQIVHRGETPRAPTVGYKFRLPSEKV